MVRIYIKTTLKTIPLLTVDAEEGDTIDPLVLIESEKQRMKEERETKKNRMKEEAGKSKAKPKSKTQHQGKYFKGWGYEGIDWFYDEEEEEPAQEQKPEVRHLAEPAQEQKPEVRHLALRLRFIAI